MKACRPASFRALACGTGAALLALGAAAAGTSDWARVGENGNTSFYFDRANVRMQADRRQVWRLFEQAKADAQGVRSGTALVEIDCKAATYRYLRTLHYSGRMGQGDYLGGSGEQPWEHIGPGTFVQRLAGLVC